MLSQRQKTVLKYIRDCLEYNYAPSYSEIAKRINTTSHNTVKSLLDELEEMGYISREHKRARRIDLLIDPFHKEGVPIKGELSECQFTPYEQVEFLQCGDLFDSYCYAIYLKDDAYQHLGYPPDSYIIIRSQRTAKRNQRVLVEHEDKLYVSFWNNEKGNVSFEVPHKTLSKKEVRFKGRIVGNIECLK